MSLGHGASIVRDGLVLHLDAANVKSYPGTGTTWYDMSGGGSNGLLYNGVTTGSNTMLFDGLNDYVHVNKTTNFLGEWTPNGTIGYQNMSIDLWIKSTDTVGVIYSKPWNGSGQYNIEIYSAAIQLYTTTYNTLTFGRGVCNGEWTNIVCWMNSTQVGYYINATEYSGSQSHGITVDAPTLGQSVNTTALMTLYPYGAAWAGNTGHAVEGELPLCRVYNRVLSSEEVKQNFEATRGRYGI